MGRRVWMSLGVLSTAVLAPDPAGATVHPPSAPERFAADDLAFFVPPDPIPPGEHGDLVRYQDVAGEPAGTARIMYLSTTTSGEPTLVTGLVGGATEPGAPVLLHGHGLTGGADHCAPSRAIADPANLLADEFRSLARVAGSAGWIVVSTDFEGVGAPGPYPYQVGISGGRTMLDAGRAARQLPGAGAGDVTAAVGFSSGGHSALWATELAADWTPEQPISAAVFAAPASEVIATVEADLQFDSPALAVLFVAGLAAAYPEAEAALADVLTPPGRELATIFDQQCFNDVFPEPGLFSGDPTTQEPFASLLAANTAGTVATDTPVLVLQGADDPIVTAAMSDTLVARLEAAGQPIERRVVEGGHLDAWFALLDDGIAWLSSPDTDSS